MARQYQKREREGEICEGKKRIAGEREKRRFSARALLDGLFGLAHETALADCCCLAVCCSDMREYSMSSHRETGRGRDGEKDRDEREGRREVKGVK